MSVSTFAARFRTEIERARASSGKRHSPDCGRFTDLVPDPKLNDANNTKDAKSYNDEYEFASMPTTDSLPSLQTSPSSGSLATWYSDNECPVSNEADARDASVEAAKTTAMKTEEGETASKIELDATCGTDADTEDIEDKMTQIEDRVNWLGSDGMFCVSTQRVQVMLELPCPEEFMLLGDDSGSESDDDSFESDDDS